MAVKKLSQLDPRWATTKIGRSKLTVGRWGCFLTSLCMGRSRLYPGSDWTPEKAAKDLKFTRQGLLIHNQDYPGFQFAGRIRAWNDEKKLKKFMRSKDQFACIAVNNDSHWVFAYYVGWFGIYILDPLDGKKKLLKRHYVPSGFALYLKK